MKRISLLLMTTALALALVGCTASAPAAAAAEKLITVNGEAYVEAVPDIVSITIGVETTGATSEEVRQKSNESINATIEAAKALGVDEKDISTSDLSLYPLYDDNGGVHGYRMNIDLNITARQMDIASKVIDSVINSGSNSLGRIRYLVSNEEELYNQALGEAVKTARAKAELLAAAEGRKVKEVYSIQEVVNGVTVRANPDTGGGSRVNAMSADTALMAGTSKITAQVTVSFVLE